MMYVYKNRTEEELDNGNLFKGTLKPDYTLFSKERDGCLMPEELRRFECLNMKEAPKLRGWLNAGLKLDLGC